jgi:hypothetical protein
MTKTILLFLSLSFVAYSYSQNEKSYRQMVEAVDVPQKVRAEFKRRYPSSFVKMWYVTNITYWYQDYGPSYYSNWYKQRTVVVYKFNEAANYEVEFANDYEDSRAIFNRYGVWFETRTKVYHLPVEVKKSLEATEYAAWNWSDYKERIEAPGMPGSVYRLQVSKNQLSEIIRVSDDGKIVQVKSEE